MMIYYDVYESLGMALNLHWSLVCDILFSPLQLAPHSSLYLKQSSSRQLNRELSDFSISFCKSLTFKVPMLDLALWTTLYCGINLARNILRANMAYLEPENVLNLGLVEINWVTLLIG